MFLGHFAVGLAGKRAAPAVSLGTWFAAAQLVDLAWPVFLLTGVEQVRIQPGITAFTPLDFERYPVTHSLAASVGWAAVFAGAWLTASALRSGRSARVRGGSHAPDVRVAALLAIGVFTHWLLDVLSHRPDVPVLPNGPFLGLGLWNSVPATLIVELALFAAGVFLYARSGAPGVRRKSFWVMIVLLFVIYIAAAFGPPPPDVRTIAISGLLLWLFVPFAHWVDR